MKVSSLVEKTNVKFGPDQFNRFGVYWIKTSKQTNTHPNIQTTYRKYIYIDSVKSLCN